MTITAAQIAALLDCSLEGDPDAKISRPARIETAVEGDFAFLDNPRYEHYAYTTQASILLAHTSFQPTKPVKPTMLRVDDVRSALAFLLQKFDEANRVNHSDVSPQAVVHESVRLGIGTSVGAFAVIEEGAVVGNNCIIYPQVYIGRNAHIGDGCTLYAGVRVHFDCVVGTNCVLHANAVIGADGFGFAPQEDKTWKKVPQVGNVVLESEVEIGACTCVDRAALGSTVIRRGTKLDNLIHVAHNVEVGSDAVLAAQVGIAGSTKLGNQVQIGGQVGFAGHLNIADGVRIQAQSGLASSVETPNAALFGSPAMGYRDFIKSHAVFKYLPELERKVLALEKRLKALENGK
jgi:UDP-3-O-[3-hydroxymyristoyl] glucosamine N-acyltransferase